MEGEKKKKSSGVEIPVYIVWTAEVVMRGEKKGGDILANFKLYNLLLNKQRLRVVILGP